MKTTLIKPKWIIIGFNIGIGMAIVYFLGFLLVPLILFLAHAIFGVASLAATVLAAALVILGALAVLILLPAFAGKTIAQLINKFRDRKPRYENRASDNGA